MKKQGCCKISPPQLRVASDEIQDQLLPLFKAIGIVEAEVCVQVNVSAGWQEILGAEFIPAGYSRWNSPSDRWTAGVVSEMNH